MHDFESINQRYTDMLQQPDFNTDAAQQQAVDTLDNLQKRLFEQSNSGSKKRWRKKDSSKPVITGLYMWGGVGRGKTFLMDLFYDTLPIEKKQRLHFHRFMEHLHADLRTLQGRKNPLVQIASDLANRTKVLCFDEFFVSDITDAMLLGTFFDALFANGVTLVTTSNIPPVDLYKDGLQRDRFLPTIALLEKNLDILNVDNGVDYRLRALEQANIYYSPLGDAADASLQEAFDLVAAEPGQPRRLEINHRHIQSVSNTHDGVAWFDFPTLCEDNRAASDYIEIARLFHTVIIGNVPVMTVNDEAAARRFINLVDEFYDRRVKLIISAATKPEALYQGTKVKFEFDRTISRLTEMQSTEYLAEAHLP